VVVVEGRGGNGGGGGANGWCECIESNVVVFLECVCDDGHVIIWQSLFPLNYCSLYFL
jgi:hypothetical protein